MPSPKVSIIILNYNNSSDTLECLKSAMNVQYPNFSVIVVDNASADGIGDIRKFIESRINSSFPLSLITCRSNLGYAGGNNMGIKLALEQGSNYVFILNNDVKVMPDTLGKLVTESEEDAKIGIIAPVVEENGIQTYGGRIKWLNLTLLHIKNEDGYPDYIPGAAMLIKKQVFEKIGLLPEEYFLYFEDADFSLKARQAGFKVKIAKNTSVRHKVSASASKLGAPLILRYHSRNSLLFNEHYAPFLYRIFMDCWAFGTVIKQTLKIIFGIQPEKSRAIRAGVFDYYRRQFGKINDQSRD